MVIILIMNLLSGFSLMPWIAGIGWLVLSPKCDYYRVQDAYNRANQEVFEPDPRDPRATPTRVTSNFGLTISPSPDWNLRDRDIISPDESSIPPLFNYARVLPWSRAVYVTALFYRAASRKWNSGIGLDGQPITGHVHGDAPRECRLGSRDQIASYCLPDDHEYSSAKVFWPPGVLFNVVVASLMSLQLQWATTGAAFLVFFFTPTAVSDLLRLIANLLKICPLRDLDAVHSRSCCTGRYLPSYGPFWCYLAYWITMQII